MGRLLITSALLLLLAGCPEGSAGPVEGAECEEIGQRCRTPDGPVGVCNDTGRTDCESPPCLACMPQH